MFEDNEKRLWAFAKRDNRFNSLIVYEKNKFKQFDKDNVKIKGSLNQLIAFNGDVIAFSKKGSSFYDGKNWKNLMMKFNVADDNFTDILVANDKSIWFADREGLYHLTTDSLKLVYKPKKDWSTTLIFERSNGEIWIGTEKNGIFVLDDFQNKHYTVDDGLGSNYIKEIFEDKQKNIWIVSRVGISKLNN